MKKNKRFIQDSQQDKNYLKRGTKISFRTAAIGALVILEEEFGELWGEGKDVEDLDEDEQYWRHIWDETRKRIKDRNDQARNVLLDTINGFSIKRKDYFYTNRDSQFKRRFKDDEEN